MSRARIIIVEDDTAIAELLEFNLQGEGYATQRFGAAPALFKWLNENPDAPVALFILDLMLPGMDGFEICSTIKQDPRFTHSLTMILTARGAEQDKVQGLESGADDYVTKPFGMREFLARVRSHIRRYNKTCAALVNQGEEESSDLEPRKSNARGESEEPLKITGFDITIDDARHRVFRGTSEVEVTHREYELLKFLMLHRGIAYSRDDLLNYVWGYEYSGETRTVDVHIRQLRRKLGEVENGPALIETVRGLGYRFRED